MKIKICMVNYDLNDDFDLCLQVLLRDVGRLLQSPFETLLVTKWNETTPTTKHKMAAFVAKQMMGSKLNAVKGES